MTQQGLSIAAFADRVGLSVNTLKHYQRQDMLPEPDVEVVGIAGKIDSRGWSPQTIDAWQAARPGRGIRFYANR